ncbi:MAG TPA: hypothetical protein VFO70_07560 [Chitinophagaceae bacterium]|nr:hypothetical protein [Chitinophagaceae bacterium]HEX5655001.1 hypothetical protein [Chitinophagaceae bacterium]
MRTGIFIFILIASCLTSCSDLENDVRDSEDLYLDYQVSGNEDNDLLTVLLQFHRGSQHGSTVLLDEPSRVELDGDIVMADSTVITGPFYEVQRPLSDFAGSHQIVFTASSGKEYREEFVFQPVSLHTALPDTIRRGELVLELGGLKKGDRVRILMTDTSFTGEGINRMDTPVNGQLLIPRQELNALLSGPVNLEIIKETETRIKKAPAGGRLFVSYGLKREFFLAD